MAEIVIPIRHNARPTTSPLETPPNPEQDAIYIDHKNKQLWTKDNVGTAYVLNPITPPPILFDISDLPLITWITATTVQVGSGVGVCRSVTDSNSTKVWNRYIGIAPVTVTLPGGLSANQDIYVYIATNGTGDSASDTAFFSTTLPANNAPTGFNWIRLIGAFKLNSSAQLNTFFMDRERWITSNFAMSNYTPTATWAASIFTGCPTGLPVRAIAVMTSGLPVVGGSQGIKVTNINPVTYNISAPNAGGVIYSGFNASMGSEAYTPSGINDIRPGSPYVFNHGIVNGSFWHYMAGSAFNQLPTARLESYRTPTTFNGVY